MPPPTYPPPVQNAVLGVQFPPSIPVMPPRAMLNPSPAKMPPPPATLDKMSGGQLVQIITGAIEGGGYTLYSPLHQQAEPQVRRLAMQSIFDSAGIVDSHRICTPIVV